jgi:iron uptake system component EfeO
MTTARHRAAAALLGALLVLAAVSCGDDDGAGVRDLGATEDSADGSASASGSGSGSASAPAGSAASGSGSASAPAGSAASGSGSASAPADSAASGSGSATGIAAGSVAQETDNPLVAEAVEGYRAYLVEQVEALQQATTTFTDAVRAGDIEAAQAAFPLSRRSWERIEPIAGLVEDIDTAVDAREDDFSGPTDESFTGWHRLEYLLWEAGDVSEAGPIADQLDADLQRLADEVPSLELPPGVLTVGAQELIEEVAAPNGKLSGEEDRYSGTDLYDVQANVEGAEALVELLAPALEEADPELLAQIREQFATLHQHLGELGSFEDGFVPYDEVTEEQKTQLAADLAALAESLSMLNGTLGLD